MHFKYSVVRNFTRTMEFPELYRSICGHAQLSRKMLEFLCKSITSSQLVHNVRFKRNNFIIHVSEVEYKGEELLFLFIIGDMNE